MAERAANNLQDMLLNNLRRAKTPVTMFLVKGVKLQGIITWFDNFSVLLRRELSDVTRAADGYFHGVCEYRGLIETS